MPFALATWYFGGTRLLGQAGFYLLTLIIFTKPLVLLFPTFSAPKLLLALRRQLGLASGVFVFVHVASQVAPGFNLRAMFTSAASSGPGSFLFWGFLGLIMITPLFLTANSLSTRLLKRNWSRLHKLVHPLYISVLLHRGLQKGTSGLLTSAAIFILLYGSRFLARRGLKFFLPKTHPIA